jgi:hypothetical protein
MTEPLLSDQEVEKLLEIKKFIPQDESFELKPKANIAFEDKSINLVDEFSNSYTLIIQRNTRFPGRFCIIFRYNDKKTGKTLRLVRLNRSHELHVNKLEKNEVKGMHLHLYREEYVRNDLDEDGYAEGMKDIDSISEALGFIVKMLNIKRVPDSKTTDLFKE